jgi:hypothetical protein
LYNVLFPDIHIKQATTPFFSPSSPHNLSFLNGMRESIGENGGESQGENEMSTEWEWGGERNNKKGENWHKVRM